jgi:hypothetical protein
VRGEGLIGHAGAVLLRKLADQDDLKDAEPDTLRPALAPGRPTDPARRKRMLRISCDLALEKAFIICWQRLCALLAST